MNESAPSIPLSIILVNYNTKDHSLECLKSLRMNLKDLEYEIIVADNASEDGSVAAIKQSYPDVKVLSLTENAGYARANNLAAAEASGSHLLILNCDTVVPAGAVELLLAVKKKQPGYAIVAPLILNEDSTFQLSFGKDLTLISEFFLKFIYPRWYRTLFKLKRGRISRTVDWVSGACFLIDRTLYQDLGGFDENFFIYIEDADLCRRVRRQNLQVYYTTEAHITHFLGGSTNRYPSQVLPHAKRSQLYYYCKHLSPFSRSLLSLYLKSRFGLKIILSRIKRDRSSLELYKNTLQTIKEFSCEADTGR